MIYFHSCSNIFLFILTHSCVNDTERLLSALPPSAEDALVLSDWGAWSREPPESRPANGHGRCRQPPGQAGVLSLLNGCCAARTAGDVAWTAFANVRCTEAAKPPAESCLSTCKLLKAIRRLAKPLLLYGTIFNDIR